MEDQISDFKKGSAYQLILNQTHFDLKKFEEPTKEWVINYRLGFLSESCLRIVH